MHPLCDEFRHLQRRGISPKFHFFPISAGSSPVHQLCEAGLWGVLYAHQEVCRCNHPTGAWKQVRGTQNNKAGWGWGVPRFMPKIMWRLPKVVYLPFMYRFHNTWWCFLYQILISDQWWCSGLQSSWSASTSLTGSPGRQQSGKHPTPPRSPGGGNCIIPSKCPIPNSCAHQHHRQFPTKSVCRHFSDTSNMYDASRRLDLKDVLTRPHWINIEIDHCNISTSENPIWFYSNNSTF